MTEMIGKKTFQKELEPTSIAHCKQPDGHPSCIVEGCRFHSSVKVKQRVFGLEKPGKFEDCARIKIGKWKYM